jgi:predicted nucleic-acid-binding Zn-ribbon protein
MAELTEHDIAHQALLLIGVLKNRACPACGTIQTKVNLSLIETTQLPNKECEPLLPWRYIAISCVQCGKTEFYDYLTVLKRADDLKQRTDQSKGES